MDPLSSINTISEPERISGKQYESVVILLTVRWYLKYSLSYRDLVEIMEEWGLDMAHTTIMRWVHEFGLELEKLTNDSFRTDETYIKVKGQWKYLYTGILYFKTLLSPNRRIPIWYPYDEKTQ